MMASPVEMDMVEMVGRLERAGLPGDLVLQTLGLQGVSRTRFVLDEESLRDRLSKLAGSSLDWMERTMRIGTENQKLALSKIILARTSAALVTQEDTQMGELRAMMGALVRTASGVPDNDDSRIVDFPDVIEIDSDE